MSIPVPTIGRIVLFRGEDGQDRPAIVTHVWSDFCVNLNIFPKDGSDTICGPRTSVTHIGPETGENPGNVSSWRWMPYQIQTEGQRYDDKPKASEVFISSFCGALSALREGKSVQRDGWNEKGLRVLLKRPDEHSKMTLPYLYIEYPDGLRCPWMASQTDILAEDWRTV